MEIWSVTQLNLYIQGLLEKAPEIARVWIQGELSNFKHHTSGHMYFTLRDKESTVKAVMFRGKNRNLSFQPENGLNVLVKGQVSVYPRDGVYQIYVEDMEPAGLGGIFLALEQTRKRLEANGLFAVERKRPLPVLPRAVGIVTAPTGAAIRDLFSVIQRRFPTMHIVFSPAIVQGEEAVPSLIRGIKRLAHWPGVDVVIIGRGGGAREDLWAFNDEALCRAIADFPVPVVSAVGHESDVSLSDLVADVRAATPSAAAELVVPVLSSLEARLKELELQLQRAVLTKLEKARNAVRHLENRPVLAYPLHRLRIPRQRVDQLEERLKRTVSVARISGMRLKLGELEGRLKSTLQPQRFTLTHQRIAELEYRLKNTMSNRIRDERKQLAMTAGLLDALSPLSVLERGFSLCLDGEGQVIRDFQDVALGNRVDIVLDHGELVCRIEDKREERRWQIKNESPKCPMKQQ